MANDRQHVQPMEQTNLSASSPLQKPRLETAESSRVKELEAELKMERMKIQGMQMLFDCMQEAHAENQRLKNLLKRRRLSWRKLRKRLQSVPSSVIQINWDEFSDHSDVEDGAGKDARSLELRQENPEDKENQHTDPSVQSVVRRITLPEGNADHLKRRLEELQHENDQLTNQLRSSGNEKDEEIVRLRKQLCEVERSRKVSGILCDTLSEEAVTLKRHLAETVVMCQRLMHTLEAKQDFAIAKPLTIARSELSLPETARKSSGDMSLPALRQQYINLELKLKEVVTMNSRWQQYNEQREEYVQQLLQRNVELEQALVNRGQQLSLAQQEHIDQILIEQRQKLDLVNEEKAVLEKENLQLRHHLEELQLAVKRSEHVIRNLHDRLATSSVEHAKALRMQAENSETLNLQMQTFREDFESERRDRERAQALIGQLESQIRSASQQLSLSRNCDPHHRHADPHHHPFLRQQSVPGETSLVGRGAFPSPPTEDRIDSGDLDLRPTD